MFGPTMLSLLLATSTAQAPSALEPLKKLAGQWDGNVQMGGKAVPVKITYEVTSGGSAVLERVMPGTPHEMVSVYTTEGSQVVMTHYCAMGNHPKLVLKKAEGHSLTFEMVGSEGLRSPGEPHMHAMTVSFNDDDHIRERWTSYEGGHAKDEKVFDLTRHR